MTDSALRHKCWPKWAQVAANIGAYGQALDGCWEDESGELWAGNGEYSSRVNYCPFCGFKARLPVTDSLAVAPT